MGKLLWSFLVKFEAPCRYRIMLGCSGIFEYSIASAGMKVMLRSNSECNVHAHNDNERPRPVDNQGAGAVLSWSLVS